MLLACLLFIPLLKKCQLEWGVRAKLIQIGAIQLGVMYILFYHSFLYLSVPEVLLFTISTPIYVSLIDGWLSKKAISYKWLMPSLVAVLGAAVIRYQPVDGDFFIGLVLVQLAGICFAYGQVAYKQLTQLDTIPAHHSFGWFFVGAVSISLVAMVLFADWSKLPQTSLHWGVLLWLGLIASGLGYFLWNSGAKQVTTSQLAVMNNMLIPAGLMVNLMIWSRDVDLIRLVLGGMVILLSLYWAKHQSQPG